MRWADFYQMSKNIFMSTKITWRWGLPPPLTSREKMNRFFFKNTIKTWTTFDLSYQIKWMWWRVYLGELERDSMTLRVAKWSNRNRISRERVGSGSGTGKHSWKGKMPAVQKFFAHFYKHRTLNLYLVSHSVCNDVEGTTFTFGAHIFHAIVSLFTLLKMPSMCTLWIFISI